MIFQFVLAFIAFKYCEGAGSPVNLPITAIYDRLPKDELPQLVDEMARDHKVLVYVSQLCAHCRDVLETLNNNYTNVNYDYYEWNAQPGGVWLINAVLKKNNAHDIPQIYICKEYIGGFDAFDKLHKSGQLASKMSGC